MINYKNKLIKIDNQEKTNICINICVFNLDNNTSTKYQISP
jgi:hypothetical protein